MFRRLYALCIGLVMAAGLLSAAGCSQATGDSPEEPKAVSQQETEVDASAAEASVPTESEADSVKTVKEEKEPPATDSLSEKSAEEKEPPEPESVPEGSAPESGTAEIPEDTAPFIIMMRPTDRFDVDGWVYYNPEDQQAWIAALKEATASRTGSERQEGGYCGFLLKYQDTYYTVIDDSYLFWDGNKSTPEGSATLMTMLAELRKEYDYYPITPEEISDITSATFYYWGETFYVTDPEVLSYIETTLSQATWRGPLTSCGFCSKLDMTTASGKTLSVGIATDSCGMFLTDGICYRFGNDNHTLYEKLLGMTKDEFRQKKNEKN